MHRGTMKLCSILCCTLKAVSLHMLYCTLKYKTSFSCFFWAKHETEHCGWDGGNTNFPNCPYFCSAEGYCQPILFPASSFCPFVYFNSVSFLYQLLHLCLKWRGGERFFSCFSTSEKHKLIFWACNKSIEGWFCSMQFIWIYQLFICCTICHHSAHIPMSKLVEQV